MYFLYFIQELYNYSITCIQRPLKGSNKSGFLQQVVLNTLPDDKIFDRSNLKQSADDNLNLLKIAESSLNKFSFSHSFQKARFPGVSNGVIVLEWVKCRFY